MLTSTNSACISMREPKLSKHENKTFKMGPIQFDVNHSLYHRIDYRIKFYYFRQ
jgi:hypothetical protein